MIKGTGRTEGSMGLLLISIAMMVGGFYLLLSAIHVSSSFGFGARLFGVSAFGGVGITGGMLMIPFIFGVATIFYNTKNLIGWLLAGGALTALIFGVISSIHFSLRSMTAFDLIVILTLSMGGLGLFLRSLKAFKPKATDR